MQGEQVHTHPLRLLSIQPGEHRALQKQRELFAERAIGYIGDQATHAHHRRRVPLVGGFHGANFHHQLRAAKPTDDFVCAWNGDVVARLALVPIEGTAVRAECERATHASKDQRFLAQCRLVAECQSDAEVAKQIDKRRLASTGVLQLVEREQHLRQRAGIVERAMRVAGIDAELAREIDELATRRGEVAREWERIVRAEVERRADLARHAADDSKIEVVPIVRDNHVVAAEGTKGRPDLLEILFVRQLLLADAMRRQRASRDAHPRLDQTVKLGDDLSIAHADGGNLDDLRAARIVVRRLEIKCGEAREAGQCVIHLEELGGLEHAERQPH